MRVVPPGEAAVIRSVSPESHLTDLLAGEMVHSDDLRARFNAAHLRRRYGVRLRTKLDGAGGRFYWIER